MRADRSQTHAVVLAVKGLRFARCVREEALMSSFEGGGDCKRNPLPHPVAYL